MRILIAGLNGTLAPKLADAARTHGHSVLAWKRSAVPPDDPAACARWLQAAAPDAIAHLAMGSHTWAAQLASFASANALPFVFTSTAMVFDHVPDGPHAPGAPRTAKDDYGRSKIHCEDGILAANAQATIVRIGWQIEACARGNNMLMALDEWQQREGCVAASRAWRPACSFMEDTTAALLDLLMSPQPGVHHLDSNARDGHSFAQIVAALKLQYGREHWQLRGHEDYVHDQRLIGGAITLPPLANRLDLPAAKFKPAGGAG